MSKKQIKRILKWQSKAIAMYHKNCAQKNSDDICMLYGQAMDFALAIGSGLLGDYVPIDLDE